MADQIPLTEAFDRLFKALDETTQKAIEKIGGVSCKKGCAHCCHLLTALTPTEGINIADRLLRDVSLRPSLEKLLGDLRNNAIASDFENVTKGDYFERRLRCPFLTSENECSIYPFRPSMCRYHVVVSPPENCSPDAPRDTRTMTLDLISLEREVWKLDAKFVKSPLPISAPISITVLWAMKMLLDGSDTSGEEGQRIKRLVDAAVKGVVSPTKWILKNMYSLVEEGEEGPLVDEPGKVR